jgi:hypothetical protein
MNVVRWGRYHLTSWVCYHHYMILPAYEYVQCLLVIQTEFEYPVKLIELLIH